jgi:CubicO group peptidase (beta-lactamase class C family)
MPEPSTPSTFAQAQAFHRDTNLGNWSDDPRLMYYAFLHMTELFPYALIHRSGPVEAFAEAPDEAVARCKVESSLGAMALEDYVAAAPVNGVVVVDGGRIVFERYPRMRPFDKHLLMSVSKIFVSTIIGVLEDRGLVEAAAPVEHYLPDLKGSAWEGTTVLDILNMASGIACPEEGITDAYTNPRQPYYHYEASLGWLAPTGRTSATPYAYMAELERARPAGEAFEYTSVNTFVLRWLAEAVLERPFNEILTEHLWSRIGAEADALVSVSRNANAPATHGGISATLRDVARLGFAFTATGRSGRPGPLVSDWALDKILNQGRPELFMGGTLGPKLTEELGEQPCHNSYQWDFVMDDGDFFKGGYGGQGLYISPRRDRVIAFFGTPDAEGNEHQMTSVARQLCRSEV